MEDAVWRFEQDAMILEKLVGRNVVHATPARACFEIRRVVGADLIVSPSRMVVLKFADGTDVAFTSLNTLKDWHCDIAGCASIGEYLESHDFWAFN